MSNFLFEESGRKFGNQPKSYSEAKQYTEVPVGDGKVIEVEGDFTIDTSLTSLELDIKYNEESDILTFSTTLNDVYDNNKEYNEMFLCQILVMIYPELFQETIEKCKYTRHGKKIISGKYEKLLNAMKDKPDYKGLMYLMRAVFAKAKPPELKLSGFPTTDVLYLYKKFLANMFCTLNFHVDNEFDYGKDDKYIADEDFGQLHKELGYDMFKGNVDREMKSTKITFVRREDNQTEIIIEKKLTTRLEDCTNSDIFLKKNAYLCHNQDFFFSAYNEPDYVGQFISGGHTLGTSTKNAIHEYRKNERKENLVKRSEAFIQKMSDAIDRKSVV